MARRAPPFSGEVVISSDRIVFAGIPERNRPITAPDSGCEVIDCTGCVIAPGFIDAHSHSDLQILENRNEKLLQGVTTEVVGNCGFSAYPLPEEPHLILIQ